ncbi:hypothetical protein JIG36_37310 [Actinoplanes sp. LDG1-06]|uniref:Lipoprotein n=1 Tax=Paractinoplanes ovalisporus TaxID=2810368 RepID=A0ABS2AMV3_9ACTN|nr:hypothetical protein [Actinoplanes ovalisporus]MBM2621176.1 hypothetical protein [Actinoplanes ovalisporus]
MTTSALRNRTAAVATSIALLLPLAACRVVADVTAAPDPTTATTQPAPRKLPAPQKAPVTTKTPVKKKKKKQPHPVPNRPATDLYGTQYAYVKAYKGNRVTFDLVEFFEWEKAQRACKQDREPRDGIWCLEYYIRNKNPRLRWLGADPGGHYEIIVAEQGWKTVSMDRFLRSVRGTRKLVKFDIDGGRILNAEQMWQT